MAWGRGYIDEESKKDWLNGAKYAYRAMIRAALKEPVDAE